MPTIVHVDGFEHQVLDTNRFGGGTTVGLWTNLTGTGFMSFVAGRTGGSALQIVSAASVSRAERYVNNSGGHRVFSWYFKTSGLPSAEVIFMDCGIAATGMGFHINTSGNVLPSLGAPKGTPLVLNVCDGNWHLLDFYVNTSANPWVLKWQVDGIDGVDMTLAATADTSGDSQHRFGHGSTASDHTLTYDDSVFSNTAADYPIGPHKVLSLVPSGDGTHVAGTNVIEDQAGTDIVSPNAFPLMDEWPANTGDYVQQAATGTGNYAEVTFPTTSETTIWAVVGAAALFSSGTTANAGTTRIVDSGGTTLTDIYSLADMSETVLHYRTALIAVPGGGSWDQTKLNGLKARVGFSNNVASVPRWSALMLQYATPESAAGTTDRPRLNVTRMRW